MCRSPLMGCPVTDWLLQKHHVHACARDVVISGDSEVCTVACAGGARVQQQQRLAVPGGSANSTATGEAAAAQQRSTDGGPQAAVVTNASLKLLAWLADYAALTG